MPKLRYTVTVHATAKADTDEILRHLRTAVSGVFRRATVTHCDAKVKITPREARRLLLERVMIDMHAPTADEMSAYLCGMGYTGLLHTRTEQAIQRLLREKLVRRAGVSRCYVLTHRRPRRR